MQNEIVYTLWRSPLGWMGLAAGPVGMVAITSPRASRRAAQAALRELIGKGARPTENRFILDTRRELLRYYTMDPRADFARIVLDFRRGTPFQRKVWLALRAIPLGEKRTYGQIARAVGRPRAARAVGQCNARNPWAILVPCHRLVGADGALTGYAGGLHIKKRLLELERQTVTAPHAMMLAAAPQRRDIYAHRD